MIHYKVINRKNPLDRTLPEKHYATVVKNGTVDFESLADIITDSSTVSLGDILNVLQTLEKAIIRELGQGRIVQLGRLGNFQVSISSKGVDTPEEVNAELITKARILFRPGRKMRHLVDNVKYQKAS